MKPNIDLLIWGEFLPNTQTGISISNSSIIGLLEEQKKTILLIEEFSWKLSSFQKIIHHFNLLFKHIKILVKYNPKHFYFNIPLSNLGLFKLLLILPVARLFTNKVRFTGHLHRGDILNFYHKSSISKLLFNLSLRCVDRIIVLSATFEEQLKSIGFEKKIDILNNTSSIEDRNIKKNKIYSGKFIYISNYIREKGIFELIECFAEIAMQSLKLDTFGNIYEQKTYDEIVGFKTSNITINPSIPHEKLKDVLCKYDALILPSWNEGQPIIILEAISIGIPVIASDVGDIKNILGQDYPFLISPKNKENIKSAVLKFDKYKNKIELSQHLNDRYFNLFSNMIYKNKIFNIFN